MVIQDSQIFIIISLLRKIPQKIVKSMSNQSYLSKFEFQQEDLKIAKVLNEALIDEVKAFEINELKKIQQQAKYCKELQEQIVNTYARKQCQYEDTLIEKKMLDDIMRTIYDEDMR